VTLLAWAFAWLLDCLIGDPRGMPHPVRWIGALSSLCWSAARGSQLWPAGGAGRLPLLRPGAGGLPYCVRCEALADPVPFSAEKGARIALANLGLEPYLNMEMQLGEGCGAALATQLVDAACAIYNETGTLAESNIVLPEGK